MHNGHLSEYFLLDDSGTVHFTEINFLEANNVDTGKLFVRTTQCIKNKANRVERLRELSTSARILKEYPLPRSWGACSLASLQRLISQSLRNLPVGGFTVLVETTNGLTSVPNVGS